MREAAITGILGILLPAWILFGLADWYFHRKSDIAHTSGWRESGLHILLTGQAGLGVLLAMFFEVTTLVALILICLYVTHELTTGVDVTWATPRRDVIAHEQRVHDYLTAIPFAALFAVIVIHPAVWAPDWSLRLRETFPPAWYLTLFLLGSALNALAYLEEFVRCWRVRL